MENFDFCQFVDVFYGNGETDRIFEDGLASKWFYIKALCGNTFPHAVLPFGKMSVGAYSGGYPTGYGTHYPNTCGGIKKLWDTNRARGFSHLHQSGTGAIQYYYNYAVISPFYENIREIQDYRVLKNEQARPGYYSAELGDVFCELTVNDAVALHKYKFPTGRGRIAVDFSNDGLEKIFGERFYSTVKNAKIEVVSHDEILCSGEFSGIKLHFCVKAECKQPSVTIFSGNKEFSDAMLEPAENQDILGAIFDFAGSEIILRVSYSTVSAACAREAVRASVLSFEDTAKRAYEIWNQYLSVIRIKTQDKELLNKFYSNLYHSLIKPCDMMGESVLGVEGDTVTDFATFWDQYKTALPFLYMCYPKMGKQIAKGIVNISRSLGKIPCSFGLSQIFPCEEQAKMLGVLSLCDAYHMGVPGVDAGAIERCILQELERQDYTDFLRSGRFERYTHILDVTDACLDVAQITDNTELKEKLLKLSANWRKAYAQDGLMSGDSPYYEGDSYTYSFRIQKNMEERVALAGGKEAFAKLLDDFFGFNADSVKQITHYGAYEEISRKAYHRFQGFNNECDMETPYAYIYADRHDRLCEIVRECVSRSFGTGKSGLPGNNDSGGLSSMFLWNVLGLFPVSGSGEFLLGSPQMEEASIALSNGNRLLIKANRQDSESHIYVERIEFNKKSISNYRISAQELMRGGILEFYMK